MKSYDLVVAGAGPAGLTLAWKAAESGLRVLVFDKKRDSGDIAYTTSASFMDLKRWGLPDDVAHPISRIHFVSARAVVELSVTACVLRRRRLLAKLEKRCLAKVVETLYRTYARNIGVRNESITIKGFCFGRDQGRCKGIVCQERRARRILWMPTARNKGARPRRVARHRAVS
jgi:flavin-dependent dehydrogenase